MIGFLLYFPTAVGILFPVALSVVDGKTAWMDVLTPAVLGAPGLLGLGAFFAIFTPRFAGVLAFAGCASCWISSGTNVVRSVQAVLAPGNLQALAGMENYSLLKYGLGWLPTIGLFLSTLYALYRSLKLPKHHRDEEVTVGSPPPP
jgi:hypothetical protein